VSALQRNLVVLVAAIACATVGFCPASALADSPPTISNAPNAPNGAGSPQHGDVLTEAAAQWAVTPVSTSIVWLDCDSAGQNCNPIAGAPTTEGSSYQVQLSDTGFTIEVADTANYGGPTTTLSSPPTLPVGPPVNTTPPSIVGLPIVGQVLTDNPGTWLGASPNSISTSWWQCPILGLNCTQISAGTSYTPTLSDLGSTILVQESASNNGPKGTTNTAPPARSTPTALVVSPTTTSLTSVPPAPSTNQPTTLSATVTSSTALAPPQGTVSFQAAGQPISGCSAVSVQVSTQNSAQGQATCQSVFSAANSPEALTAVFTPSAGAAVGPSTSPTYSMGVGTDSTTTTLDVSNPIVDAGKSATYTATVRPLLSGPFQPTGQVVFLDYGKRISQCPATPLHFASGVATAQCVVNYAGVGNHSITAFYLGGGGFAGSGSIPQAVTVKRLPPKIRGTMTAKMLWTFRFFPTYTQVLSLNLQKPGLGTVVLLTCHGSFCPFAHRSITVKKRHACVVTPGHTSCYLTLPPSVNLATAFGKSKLHVGDVLTIELTRPSWIGKGYVFTIRAGKGPKFHIGCLAPGSTKIGVGCLTPVSKKKRS
jgi:Bacterial Ig-like domain (group 3)